MFWTSVEYVCISLLAHLSLGTTLYSGTRLREHAFRFLFPHDIHTVTVVHVYSVVCSILDYFLWNG